MGLIIFYIIFSIFKLYMNIFQNIVNPTKHCYGSKYCYGAAQLFLLLLFFPNLNMAALVMVVGVMKPCKNAITNFQCVFHSDLKFLWDVCGYFIHGKQSGIWIYILRR